MSDPLAFDDNAALEPVEDDDDDDLELDEEPEADADDDDPWAKPAEGDDDL
ncbi:MAG: hypothetical protein QOH73_1856 [Gaiellaceae bacterium]|jgi:hypothetical protein|nr:hypothetical protein [Gaiellaceae bacterium]